MRSTRPATGLRLIWQSYTLMKIETCGRKQVGPRLRLLRQLRRIAIGRAAVVSDFGQNSARELRLALPVPHTGIKALTGEQLAMRAALDDCPTIQHEDLVGIDDGRKP